MQRIVTILDTALTVNYNDRPISTQKDLDTYKFQFDDSWLGYVKTAVFYTDPAMVKHLLIPEDGVVTIPWEILTGKPQVLYIGVFGTKDTKIKPTTFGTVRLREGSYVDGIAPLPPTPDVYQQIIGAWEGAKADEVERIENENARGTSETSRRVTFDALVLEYNGLKAAIEQEIADGTASVDALQVLEADYAAKALALETTYAPQLAAVKSQLAETQSQFQQVIANATVDSEVVNARGGKVNLNTRLNDDKTAINAQLAEIANNLVEHKLDYVEQRSQDQLKVATVEKDINDYKSTMASVNPNQEAKQKVTGYGTISLPKNTANGQANISLKGNTIADETGTKYTISASRLKSVGKNLFDKNGKLIHGKELNSIGGLNNTPLISISDFITVQSGKTYKIFNNGNRRWHLYDKRKNFISTNFEINPIVSVIVDGYIRFDIPSTDIDKCQLEQNTVATPYEPYTESTQYLPNVGELRSLPNGVKDEIRVSGGKAEHIQRNKKYVLKNVDAQSVNTAYTNIDRVFIQLPADAKLGVTSESGNVLLNGYTETKSVSDDIININKFFHGTFYGSPDKICLYVAKGTYADVTSARTALTGTELTYKLSEPIITPINVSGNLISYPSGTVYVENVVADAGNYTTKFDIKELQLPIKSIDKLIKYNFTTGVQTVLDTNLAVISGDKKSFTHPNLIDKDMVFVDYFYDIESTLGETTIEYLDSRHTIKDTTNNKFYKWNIKSTNGVPTVSLTEVL